LVSRKRLQHDSESSINKKLDELAENIKRLPESRKQLLEEMLEKRLFNSLEASEILGVSLASLRRSLKLGHIKKVYVGRMLRIPAEEIARLLEGEVHFFSTQETASLLKVGRETVVRLIKSGKIKALRITPKGVFKIPKSEIDRITTEGVSD
jgi:excisionase family DNA binding protein